MQCEEKNRFLIANPRKIFNKAQHFNKGKLYLAKYDSSILSKYRSSVLSNNTVNEISKVLHWQIDKSNSNAYAEECNFKDDLTAKKYYECHITLKTIPSDNVNKLIFAHLNINYTRNKFGFLVTQVKGKIDI